MGLTSFILKRIGYAPARDAERGNDRIIKFLSGWQTSNVSATTQNRVDFIYQYRGWVYVAIKSICQEAACLVPQVSRIVDGDEVKEGLQKSLTSAGSFAVRDTLRKSFANRFISKALKKKALAHLQDSDELEPVSSNHPLVKLLQNPNGPDVAYTFIFKLFMYLKLCGTAYVWVVPNKAGRPVQLWCVPSHWVREFPTDVNGQPSTELIGSYEIRPQYGANLLDSGFGMGWFPGAGGATRVDASEIIKFADPNPMSLTDGYSAIAAASSWVDVSNQIGNARVQTFANAAYPGVILQLDPAMSEPDQEALERIKIKFEEKIAGVRNQRKAYVLAPGMTLLPSPYGSAVEMDFVNSETQSRDQILAAFRVGPTIAGITEQTSFAADTAARLGFYHGTLKSDLTMIGQILTEKLATRFEENLSVWWSNPEPDDPDYVLKKFQAMIPMSAATVNEFRESQGMTPFPHGGDDPCAAPGMQPLSWATGEDHLENQMQSMMGPDGQQTAQPTEDANDPLDDVMGQLLGGGNDGATAGVIPSPLANREKSISVNGNGKHSK